MFKKYIEFSKGSGGIYYSNSGEYHMLLENRSEATLINIETFKIVKVNQSDFGKELSYYGTRLYFPLLIDNVKEIASKFKMDNNSRQRYNHIVAHLSADYVGINAFKSDSPVLIASSFGRIILKNNKIPYIQINKNECIGLSRKSKAAIYTIPSIMSDTQIIDTSMLSLKSLSNAIKLLGRVLEDYFLYIEDANKVRELISKLKDIKLVKIDEQKVESLKVKGIKESAKSLLEERTRKELEKIKKIEEDNKIIIKKGFISNKNFSINLKQVAMIERENQVINFNIYGKIVSLEIDEKGFDKINTEFKRVNGSQVF